MVDRARRPGMAMGVVQPQTNDNLMACDQQSRKEVGSSLSPRGTGEYGPGVH